MKNERMDWIEVEELIEKRIAEESEIYDLDSYDIAEIRLETYKECGWDYDAGRDEDEDEENEAGEEDWAASNRSMTAIYFDLGLNIHDHFCCR